MSKVYVFLADGFEEIEGLTVVDILRRAGVETKMVSITGNRMVEGSHNIKVEADMLYEEGNFDDSALLVLPGGMPGTRFLGEHKELTELLKRADNEERGLAAICAAPTVLGMNGILEGRKAVCYPGMEEKLLGADVVYEPVVTDGHITTGRGMGCAVAFALELVKRLCGEEKALELGKGIVYFK